MDLQSVKRIIENPKYLRLLQLLLAVVSIAMVAYSGNKMLSLPLWGYLPLTFFGGLWLFFNVVLGFVKKNTQSSFYWFLSIVTGVSLHLAFPDPSITPLIFLGFIPLLYIVEMEHDQKKGAWRTFRYAYSAFLLWNILTTFWVANTSFVPSIIAFTLNSLFMTIPFMLFFHFRKRFSLRLSLIAFIAFWISFEMIHLRWEISWPWLTLGNAFASRTLWVQWYEFTGHIGGSFWALATNAFLFYVLMDVKANKELKPRFMLIPMIILMAPIMISFFIFFGYQEKGEWVNVTVVQPNFEPHYEKFDLPEEYQLDRFLRLTNENISDTTDYVVFPETSFGLYDLDKLSDRETIKKLQNVIDSFPNLRIVTGLVSYQLFDEKYEADNLREITRNGKTRYLQLQNSAVELTNDRENIDYHIKGKLVPGAEIFPYSKLLFFLEPIVKKSGGTTSGHGRGAVPGVFSGGKANVAPAICYESIYAYWMRKFVLEGADLIFVITNDGWWDNTPGHRQHLGFSILRAIELRKSIARSANTGVSCIIDQHGRVFKPLAYGTEGAIKTKMQANPEKTFYANYGDIIGRICYLLSCIFLAFMFRLKFRKNKGDK